MGSLHSKSVISVLTASVQEMWTLNCEKDVVYWEIELTEISALKVKILGPVVQSISSLTKLLVKNFIKFNSTHKINYDYIFLLKNCERFCSAKAYYIFPQKMEVFL